MKATPFSAFRITWLSLALLGATARTVIAQESEIGWTITASAGANGSIIPSGAIAVADGADQSLTITADPCWHVADVVVDGISVGPATEWTFSNVTADHAIAATFTIDAHTITATAGAGGGVIPGGAVTVDCGTDRSFAVVPDAGHHVLDVVVDGVSVGARTDWTFVNVHTDHTIHATFEINSYTLLLEVAGNGTLSRSPDQPVYPHGSVVTLTAAGAAGWHFAGWSGDASGTANPLSVTMDDSKAITATFLENIYTWDQSGAASWQVSTHWTPERIAPTITDVLIFDGGAVTVTDVPTQSVAQLLVRNGGNVTLQAAATGTLLTLRGAAGADLDVPAACALNVSGTNTLSIGLGTSLLPATGDVAGSTAFSSAAHRFVIGTASGNKLTYRNGALCTGGAGLLGSMFGTAPLNSVVFQAGSTYSHVSGANPFGASAPGSVVVFETGSKYRIDGTGVTPSTSGRVYADFEMNAPGTSSASGTSPVTMDHLTVTQGTLSFNTFAASIRVKGNLTVQPGATLNFAPASVQTLTLEGVTPQTITRGGTFNTNAQSRLEIANAEDVTIATNLTHLGTIQFTSGRLATGFNVLSLGATGTLTGASPATGWVFGNLRRTMTAAGGEVTRAFELGDATRYTPVTVAMHALGAAFDLTARTTAGDHPNLGSAPVEAGRSVNRWWILTATGAPSFSTFDATFGFDPGDLDAGTNASNLVVKRWNGSDWFVTGVGARTSTSTEATGILSFGEFAVAEPPQVSLALATVGTGTIAKVPDLPSHDVGSTVRLTAIPGDGWTFMGWSGDAGGTSNPVDVVMDGDKSVTATFADLTPPVVTVTFPNGGEVVAIGGTTPVTWTATDGGGVTAVDLLVSRTDVDGPYEMIAAGVPNTGSYDWFVTPPGTNAGPNPEFSAYFKVVAYDVLHSTSDVSDSAFAIYQPQPGAVGDQVVEFALTRVGPNPSRGRVLMEFSVAEETSVRLSVLDVQGREVALVAAGVQQPGRYSVVWSGESLRGGPAPAGVYFVRYQGGGRSATKRVALTR